MRKKIFLISGTVLFILVIISTAYPAEKFPIPYSSKLDLTESNTTIKSGDTDISITMERPARAFKKLKFTFLFKINGKAVSVESAVVKFNMKMDMGPYSSTLKRESGKNLYTAYALLPKCRMGGKQWFGKLEYTINGKTQSIVYIFNLK